MLVNGKLEAVKNDISEGRKDEKRRKGKRERKVDWKEIRSEIKEQKEEMVLEVCNNKDTAVMKALVQIY